MELHGSDVNLSTFCNVGGLCKENQDVLVTVGNLITPFIQELTDRFYESLQDDPQTAPYLEGRLDMLKKTHVAWMKELFAGDYGEDFIRRQEKIGDVHVRVRVPPLFVAASMSFLRGALPKIISEQVHDTKIADKGIVSILQLLDLCQYLIDRSYNHSLMDNLGISQGLLVRLQTLGRKA